MESNPRRADRSGIFFLTSPKQWTEGLREGDATGRRRQTCRLLHSLMGLGVAVDVEDAIEENVGNGGEPGGSHQFDRNTVRSRSAMLEVWCLNRLLTSSPVRLRGGLA